MPLLVVGSNSALYFLTANGLLYRVQKFCHKHVHTGYSFEERVRHQNWCEDLHAQFATQGFRQDAEVFDVYHMQALLLLLAIILEIAQNTSIKFQGGFML